MRTADRSRLLASLFAAAVVGLVLLAGCGGFGGGKPKKVTSSDGAFEMTVPGRWRSRTDLHDEAELQVTSPGEQLCLIVLSEPKADFDASVDVAKHSELTRTRILGTLANGRIRGGPVQMTIGGLKALQYEIEGTMQAVRLVYLHTTIESPKRFHQVLAWTSRSKFPGEKATLQKVIESFREK
jgi:hypothetical protein